MALPGSGDSSPKFVSHHEIHPPVRVGADGAKPPGRPVRRPGVSPEDGGDLLPFRRRHLADFAELPRAFGGVVLPVGPAAR